MYAYKQQWAAVFDQSEHIAPTDILRRLRILWLNEIEYVESRIISRKITFPQKSTVRLIY